MPNEKLSPCLKYQGCENKSASYSSPGVVLDNESLIRLIFSPYQIDQETGIPKPAAFSDVANIGMSVNRKNHTNISQLKEIANEKVIKDNEAGKTRSFEGIVVANCGDIRSILFEDNNQAFFVYDTAKRSNLSHADICQIFVTASKGKKLRKKLRDKFSKKVLDIDSVS